MTTDQCLITGYTRDERLTQAYELYWGAHNSREQQASYHEILLFGGFDGYSDGEWRSSIARWLRRAAMWVDPY